MPTIYDSQGFRRHCSTQRPSDIFRELGIATPSGTINPITTLHALRIWHTASP